jgi:hypothetical protein
VLLGKNACDLQERLRDTRHELHLTQKQLYAIQKAEAEAIEISPDAPQTHSGSKFGAKHNQIMNFNGVEDFGGKTGERKGQQDQDNEQLDNFSVNAKGPKVKQNRLGLRETKYNWLFNDDETPREEDPANPNTGIKTRGHKYLENEEQTTAANSNFVSRP